jgi:hypothetical protein
VFVRIVPPGALALVAAAFAAVRGRLGFSGRTGLASAATLQLKAAPGIAGKVFLAARSAMQGKWSGISRAISPLASLSGGIVMRVYAIAAMFVPSRRSVKAPPRGRTVVASPKSTVVVPPRRTPG